MSLKQFQKPQNLSIKSIWNPTAGVEDTQKYAFLCELKMRLVSELGDQGYFYISLKQIISNSIHILSVPLTIQ